MMTEIDSAVLFILKLINAPGEIPEEKIALLKINLTKELLDKFRGHWYVDIPQKGQAYRCLRINNLSSREPSIYKAAINSGIKYEDLSLPIELTVWIDPENVSCRFGEHKGSHCNISCIKNGTAEINIDNIDFINLPIDSNESEDGEDSFAIEADRWNNNTSPLSSNSSSGCTSPDSYGQQYGNVQNNLSSTRYSNDSGYNSPPNDFNGISQLNMQYLQQSVPGVNTAFIPSPRILYTHNKLPDYKADWLPNYVPHSQGYPFVPMNNSVPMSAPNDFIATNSFVPMNNSLPMSAPNDFIAPNRFVPMNNSLPVSAPNDFIASNRFVTNFVNNLKWVSGLTPTI